MGVCSRERARARVVLQRSLAKANFMFCFNVYSFHVTSVISFYTNLERYCERERCAAGQDNNPFQTSCFVSSSIAYACFCEVNVNRTLRIKPLRGEYFLTALEKMGGIAEGILIWESVRPKQSENTTRRIYSVSR